MFYLKLKLAMALLRFGSLVAGFSLVLLFLAVGSSNVYLPSQQSSHYSPQSTTAQVNFQFALPSAQAPSSFKSAFPASIKSSSHLSQIDEGVDPRLNQRRYESLSQAGSVLRPLNTALQKRYSNNGQYTVGSVFTGFSQLFTINTDEASEHQHFSKRLIKRWFQPSN